MLALLCTCNKMYIFIMRHEETPHGQHAFVHIFTSICIPACACMSGLSAYIHIHIIMNGNTHLTCMQVCQTCMEAMHAYTQAGARILIEFWDTACMR